MCKDCLIHLKSHNASARYPSMHHFVTGMCTCEHISVTKWCIVDMGLVHCGICVTGLLPLYPSLHQLLPREHQRDYWRKQRMQKVSNLINICHTNSIQILNLHIFFYIYILFVFFKWYFGHYQIFLCWYWGPHFKARKFHSPEQSKHNFNPK